MSGGTMVLSVVLSTDSVMLKTDWIASDASFALVRLQCPHGVYFPTFLTEAYLDGQHVFNLATPHKL
jgi:hypothetical protein